MYISICIIKFLCYVFVILCVIIVLWNTFLFLSHALINSLRSFSAISRFQASYFYVSLSSRPLNYFRTFVIVILFNHYYSLSPSFQFLLIHLFSLSSTSHNHPLYLVILFLPTFLLLIEPRVLLYVRIREIVNRWSKIVIQRVETCVCLCVRVKQKLCVFLFLHLLRP